jgi:uncharacterized protein YbaA (DUF1428 family)
MAFMDLFVGPVPTERKDAYRAYAEKMGRLTMQAGALSVAACWAADVPDGMPASLAAAAEVGPGETLVMRMVKWPSREARDAGWAEMMKIAATLTEPIDAPFDRSRVRYGGFEDLGEM